MSQFLAPILLTICALAILSLCFMYVYETAISIKNARELRKLEEELIQKRIDAIAKQDIKIDRLIAYSERIIRQHYELIDKL